MFRPGRQQAQAVAAVWSSRCLRAPVDGDRCDDLGLDLEGTDVDRAVDDPREACAGRWSRVVRCVGSTARAMLPAPMAGLPETRGNGLGRSAVVGERAESRVGDADLVAVDAVDQPAGAAGADQVVCAGNRAGDVAGRAPLPVPWVLSATIVLSMAAEPDRPPVAEPGDSTSGIVTYPSKLPSFHTP